MAEMLPSLQAEQIRQALTDFLTTTFALADPEPRRALTEFLADPTDGIFKGPYVRLRLPFEAAPDGWESSLDWQPSIRPYGHQAKAYARLTSKNLGPDRPRPLPTLVTTGTGSGKTEAFLHPILDHVVRARREGVTGTKALILYPMNALADDQAQRLTKLLTTDPALRNVTAGIYTGNQSGSRTTVSAKGLITDRAVLRDSPPDILLTNYKMLDQLLLRQSDQRLWERSATSLQYLVLDEFHTYDGAQGTDVALLLRRLGIALKSWWPADHPDMTDEDRQRPLGRLTPVATSATLGDGDPTAMLHFAHTVFGETFGAECVVTESRVAAEEWCQSADSTAVRLADLTEGQLQEFAAIAPSTNAAPIGRRAKHAAEPETVAQQALRILFGSSAPQARGGARPVRSDLLTLAKAHPDVHTLVKAASLTTATADLLPLLFPSEPRSDEETELRTRAVDVLVAALSQIRATSGREALSVDLTLWVRELTRIDRAASSLAEYRWSDDGTLLGAFGLDASADVSSMAAFPAIYCRHCGRSGWGVSMASTGNNLLVDDDTIRANHAMGAGRFRALLYAPGESDALASGTLGTTPIDGLRWFSPQQRMLLTGSPSADEPELLAGRLLPVLTQTGDNAEVDARADNCPSCLQTDGIRFLGSAIATQLSVTLTSLFGNPALNAREKRALVFTDSVQDAAHRAGFVRARSHTMSLRAALRAALGDFAELTLDTWVAAAVDQAKADAFSRYRLVPPECVDMERFKKFWATTRPSDIRAGAAAVLPRLLFDAELEVGLQSTFGRTLEATGSIGVQVNAGAPESMARIARAALGSVEIQQSIDGVESDESVIRWVRGTVEHIRRQGGIHHPWLHKFLQEDGARYRVWGGRPRDVGMPAFPSGRSTPTFPRVGQRLQGNESLLENVTSPQGWYTRWTIKTLVVSAPTAPHVAKALLQQLAAEDVLQAFSTNSSALVYALPPGRITVRPLTDGELAAARHLLVCDVCRAQVPGDRTMIDQLSDGPCLNARCPGHLRRTARNPNYYRTLFSSSDMRRIAASEHSSLLDDKERRAVEDGFKRSDQRPGDPNVLVATPTLEMGIDIGDLSSVLLASLPDSVAKYQQRVGRAGRLSGSALNLAFVTGRGDQLPRLGEPLSLINGVVRPPATYLNAEEILKRQFVAHLIDSLAREPHRQMPRTAEAALASSAPGTLLGDLVALVDQDGAERLTMFLSAVEGVSGDIQLALQQWVIAQDDSGLIAQVYRVAQEWSADLERLNRRRAEIEASLPELQRIAAGPAASDDEKRAARSAVAAVKGLGWQLSRLTSDPWISALEERGLLPNYTLLDDSVTLEVNVTWTDPDSGKFESSGEVVDRGSARALREFAPGATFFGRGLAMHVDGVDLGQEGQSVAQWAVCSECGYAQNQSEPGQSQIPSACPRCGSAQIADMQQRVEALRLTRAFSDVRRDRDQISDGRDERTSSRFQVVAAADLNPAGVTTAWTVPDVGFGVTHYRRLVIRWFNLGASAGNVVQLPIAGQMAPAPLFRVCESCGKLDQTAGSNSPREHRPWCPHRTSHDEHTRSIALYRELNTQGVVIALPQFITLADRFAMPSLAAALLAGLREEIGGSPDHLQVEVINAPVVGGAPGEVREALLLHDRAPGGTGYLTDLASPQWIWRVLCRAYELVAECPCQDENRQACHRCLLPFTIGRNAQYVSRSVAHRHLRNLLQLDDADVDTSAMAWTVEAGQVGPTDPSSILEQRFRAKMLEALPRIGVSVREQPGPDGAIVNITGASGGRNWVLRPQVLLHGSKPDFLLQSVDPQAPRVAIFCDGWAYHASQAHNRIADDAEKREQLRANGYRVISVVHEDLDDAVNGAPFVRDQAVTALLGQAAGQPGSGFNQTVVDDLRAGPIRQLTAAVADPISPARTALSSAVWLLLTADGSRPVGLPDSENTAAHAGRLLRRESIEGPVPAMVWHRDHLTVLTVLAGDRAERSMVVLDNSAAALASSTHHESWRLWLALSNALAFADYPIQITVTEPVAGAVTSAAPSASQRMLAALAGMWALLPIEQMSQMEYDLSSALAMNQSIVPIPEVGIETDDGIPLDFAWKEHHVAVLMEPDDETVDELRAEGWLVVPPDVESILNALGISHAMSVN